MSAQSLRSRSFRKTAAVLFLPAACVLAVAYLMYERPPEPRRSNELAPSNISQGFTPGDVSTPMVSAESRSEPSQRPDEAAIKAGQKAAIEALEARRATVPAGDPAGGLNRR